MITITLTPEEARIADGCTDVNFDIYTSCEPPKEQHDIDAFYDNARMDGLVLRLEPSSLAAKWLLNELYECPYEEQGFSIDDICSLARKLRDAGVVKP